jgi:hypothetical protein
VNNTLNTTFEHGDDNEIDEEEDEETAPHGEGEGERHQLSRRPIEPQDRCISVQLLTYLRPEGL